MIEPQTNNKNYKMLINIFAIIIGMGIILGVSYAIFRSKDVGEKTNRLETGSFGLEINNESADGISVTNALPMTFDEGTKTTPYTFTLENTGDYDIDYKLGLEPFEDSNMPNNVVRYLCLQGENATTDNAKESDAKRVSEAIQEEVADENNDVKTVYYIETGLIKAGESKQYTLYLWIDHEATTAITGTKFKVKARADGEVAQKKPDFKEPTAEELQQMKNSEDNYVIAENSSSTYKVQYAKGDADLESTSAISVVIDGSMYVYYSKDTDLDLSDENPVHIKANVWYTVNGPQFTEYSGSCPFSKEDLTTIYSDTYLDYVISLFK